MKLTAMRDQWNESQNPTISKTKLGSSEYSIDDLNAKKRQYASGQFSKHAQDLCRIVAMSTRKENDEIDKTKAVIQQREAFLLARTIVERFFDADDGIAIPPVAEMWAPEDLTTIRNTIRDWFEVERGL